MTASDLIKDQVLKTKLNIYSRLKIWRFFGKPIPIYNKKFEKQNRYLKTLRFALIIRLCQYNIPYSIMNVIIKSDYMIVKSQHFLRKLLKTIYSALRVFLPVKTTSTRNNKYKIVMIGGYGYKDIGDEAMPHADKILFRNSLGNELELVMLSHNPKLTKEYHNEESCRDFTLLGHHAASSILKKLTTINATLILLSAALCQKYFGISLRLWAPAREALNEISSADLIFNVGGGNINSEIPIEFYKKCTTYLIAKILGIPVFLSGQTMGPYRGWVDRNIARIALNTVNVISFRDKDTSYKRLKEIGVYKPDMFDAADDAISLIGIDKVSAINLLERDIKYSFAELKKKHSMIVFLNLKGSLRMFKGHGRSNDILNECLLMAKLADRLTNTYNCAVVFIATDFSQEVDDRVLHKQTMQYMKNKESVFCMKNEYTDLELIGIIGLSDIAIGGRYHFCVFSASTFTPFIGLSSGIYQRTKLKGIADLCGLPECYIDMDMETAELEPVFDQIKSIVERKEEIKKKLELTVPTLKINSTIVVQKAVSYLKEKYSYAT